MDIRKKRKGLAAATIIMAMGCIMLLLIFIATNPVLDKNMGNKTVLESTESATLNSTYGSLYHGSTYKYTDYRKVEQTHSGTITDDTTTVYVDLTYKHGSQENPFVIDSITRWNAFVADMRDTTSGIKDYGSGKYFVLTKDLDFNGVTFNSVPIFNGTFYGLGHSFNNVLEDGNGKNTGLIDALLQGTVTDLNNVNYSIVNVDCNSGGIVGYTHNAKILNCHAQGVMSRTTYTPNQVCCGGISGGSHRPDSGESKNLYYRCSAKFSVSGIDTGKDSFCGGIVGMVWHPQAITILDCHSEYTSDAPKVVIPYYMGAIAGLISEVSQARIENCTAKFNPTPNIGSTAGGLYSGLFPIYSQRVVSNTANSFNVKIKNVYLQSENDSYTFYPVTTWGSVVSHLDPTVAFDLDNIQYVQRHAYDPLANGIEKKYINGSCTPIADVGTMWNDAKATSSPLTNSIWDKNKINSTYSIENSPVINSLVKTQFNVEFKNYRTSGDVSLGVSDIKYDGGAALALPQPSAPDNNHKFVGWTTDKSGESEPFTSMPANMYGDVTLYAVWDNPNATADFTLSNSFTKDGTDTIEYGTGEITLTATSDGPGMNSPTKTFKWYKDSETTAVETGNTCVLKNVKQTGKYSLEYKLQDKDEPLWIHTEKLTKTQSVTITKGTLSVDMFSIDSKTPAYYGMRLGNVKFNIQVKDKGNNIVAGSGVWQTPNNKVKDGLNDTYSVRFTPTDTDNYNIATLGVEFESEYVTMTYNLNADIPGEEIVVNLEYGQPYSANKIINMFLTEFRKKIDEDDTENYDPNYASIANLTPYFNGVEITQYNTGIADVTELHEIVVTFVEKNYTVTFKNDDGSVIETQMRKYNQKLVSVSNPVKEEHVFMGWNYEDVDDLGNTVTKHWDFDEDRVKGDVTLTADWFKATLTLTGITVTPKAGGYEATSVIEDGDLEVIAHYTTDSAEYPTMDIKLRKDDATGYKIIYGSSDGKLHVNNAGITVVYEYGGVTKTERMTLTVNPKSLDAEMEANGVTFEDCVVKYDGTAKEIGEVKGELPIQISEVEYEYWIGGNKIDKSEVVNIGLYTVRAVFVSSDPDYTASVMEAKLTISRTGASGDTDPDDPNSPDDPDGDKDGNGGTLDEILAKLKDLPLWQLIASIISIILIIAFLSKTASNESKRKKTKKVMEKKYNTFYASAFLGISVTNWTVIASVLMGVAVLSFVFMLISQKRLNKAEEDLDDAKEEFERNKEDMYNRRRESENNRRDEEMSRRDEDLKMILMSLFGGNGNVQGGQGQPQGFAYAQPSLGAEEIRGIVSDTITALLPGVQQMLPQQASVNDELVQKLIEQNEKNEQRIEKLMQKLTEQQSAERVIEKQVLAATNVNDEAIKSLIEGQKAIMEKLAQQPNQPQIVEKVVEVPVEKVVEKPVEKIVEKEVRVEVPVEKIVEKEVVKEVKVEVPVEVEKVVEKIVEIPAEKPAPKAKTVAPRLTLDEAYAKLSAKQKKFFDTLKEYAMSKDKCKEKKSTYYILLGQSSVNPLVKLTIKKDCTVALFKMEDEYFKDIRRNAGSEGTKVKVKESELIVGDAQALATAKEMIDLREDQIERYNDFLKEQRSLKKR